MTTKKLFDYALNENVDLFVLIKAAETRKTKNDKQFIAFNFADKSGEISAKYWDASDEDIVRFQAGKIVHLIGKRENYQNNPQIKIYSIQLTNAEKNEPQDPAMFVEGAPEDMSEMQKQFESYLFDIHNNVWNRVVRYLLKKYQDKFFVYPAAKKNHHAFAGGLAFHTLSILRLAQAVSKEYPEVNSSLLYAGAILHDLGKVIELSGPVATQYTVEGNLIGHIVLIDEEIIQACQELEINPRKEDAILLRHVILAHHGLLEYGSPVQPHILEAEILHHLDDLDASIQMMNGSLKHVAPGEFSERIFGLEGRNFYKPHEL
ncbi:HD domain-containing protein [Ligilactobacillus sp. WILCCON 0076]|uniref:HD domain-containing protein n=1 Tax=Ligilactobacillus ubinensis TaxID=2876789 RepID=A0A9X2JL94_9LACO|nr:HD domain-containing protein [Ligilactobacillus ubinensis]MCP0886753.1 HD domain-containing protein [Ligilactobacillus ubinensis]